MSFFYILN